MFINPERASFPDIDTDFEKERREEVIEYVTNKYGPDKVCSIITLGTMAAKGAFKDSARRFKLPFDQANNIAKMIPDGKRGRAADLKTALKEEEKLKEVIKDPAIKKIFDVALILEGVTKNTGIHAAGVVISDLRSLIDLIGLQLDKKGRICSVDDKNVLDKLGFIKFDFLGLETLTIIKKTVEWIRINHGIDLDMDEIEHDDPVVMDMICRGLLTGVFQLGGSSGFKEITIMTAPKNISNISDINAMYRPGPLDNKFPEKYADNVRRKNEGKPIVYMMTVDNPERQKDVEAILEPTFGVCLYQEQIQFIAQKVAGYSLGRADLLRRAIGKKDPKEMEAQRGEFIDGCIKNKISKASAEELFHQIEKFADYCFNKSHSIAYSILSYETAWLKYYYPYEFLAANLSLAVGDEDKMLGLINACRDENIPVLPPHINESGFDFTPSKEGIRFGLNGIKGLGATAIMPIIEERNRNGRFTSFISFIERMKGNSKIKKSDIEKLILAGCFN